ncbi:MAG: dihydrodipicolinate synthase family protein [Actinobacteria bacterium]|nr:dihydrodipicolinate synthase family protein [Actinomycetota bacterium]MBV9662418.1 dihydrodipicolinate synthase family protein [Actinomycetota bacterium]MBV9936531.1 dihydrodipicolinate synthase family protein [Actinomycetota bacterium]
MAGPVFTGVGVAIVTLFDDGGAVDAKATADLAAQLVDLGMQAVVVAGSTGEAASLNVDERTAVIQAVKGAVTTVPVIAGTGGPSARQAIAFTRAAVDAGADAVLSLSPPGSADVRPYYDAVAEAAGDVPLLAYHFPAVSAPGFPVDVLLDLPVEGCKDSSGSPDRLLETRDTWNGPLYVGSSALLSMAGPLGCAGAILALANAYPERCIQAFEGDAVAQLDLAGPHRRAAGRFPAGIKELTAERFGTPTATRMG